MSARCFWAGEPMGWVVDTGEPGDDELMLDGVVESATTLAVANAAARALRDAGVYYGVVLVVEDSDRPGFHARFSVEMGEVL